MNAAQLRALEETTLIVRKNILPVIFILEDIYDTYNVGGIFRLADALNIEKIILTGETEIPPNHKIKKASVGTYKIVPWEYKSSSVQAIQTIKRKTRNDIEIIAVEQSESSIPYYSYHLPLEKNILAFVVGNETKGISPQALSLCDRILEIPMFGINKSLNVIVSLAIVSYHIILSAPANKIRPNATKEYKKTSRTFPD